MPTFEDEEEYEWEDSDDEEEEEVEEEETDLDVLIDETEELVETGQARRAIRIWKKSMDRFADEPRAFYQLGWACYRYLEDELGGRETLAGDPELLPFYEEGIYSLEEAVSMEPDNQQAWNLAARLYLMRDKKKAAIEALEKSLEIDDSQDDIQEMLDDLRS